MARRCISQASRLVTSEHRQMIGLRRLVQMALAEDLMALAAVRAAEIAVVLHKADDGHMHHLGHAHGLGHDHGDKLLRRGDNHNAVHRQGLEDRQGHVARSGRHVDEQIVDIFPHDVRPELLHRARNDGAAPENRVVLVLEQQIHGHDLDAAFRHGRVNALLIRTGAFADAKRLRDGRTGDIGVQHAGAAAGALHGRCQHGRNGALADAALAGHDRDDLIDAGTGTQRLLQGLRLVLGTGLAAGRTVVRAVFGCFVVIVTHCGGFLHFSSMLALLYPESAGSQPASAAGSAAAGCADCASTYF